MLGRQRTKLSEIRDLVKVNRFGELYLDTESTEDRNVFEAFNPYEESVTDATGFKNRNKHGHYRELHTKRKRE